MAIAPPASLQSANGLVWQGLQQQQAQRAAEQAEVRARALKDKAAAAEGEAQRAQERARALGVEASQADQQAGDARQGLASLRSLSDVQQFLQETRDQLAGVVDGSQASETPAATATSTAVINTSGQATGLIVNVTA